MSRRRRIKRVTITQEELDTMKKEFPDLKEYEAGLAQQPFADVPVAEETTFQEKLRLSDEEKDFYTRLSDENLLRSFLDGEDIDGMRRKMIKFGLIIKGMKEIGGGPIFTDYGKEILAKIEEEREEE